MDRLGVPATTRASFGVYNDADDIDRLVDALHDARQVFQLD
jgi:cysteine desulfurase/selenocysteine lyase